MNRKAIVFGILFLPAIFLQINVWAQIEKQLIGSWKSENNYELSVSFFKDKSGLYQGKIDDNKDSDFGKIVFKGMNYNDKTQTFSGILSPAKVNINLDATISFINNNRIKVVGKKMFITKTVYFSRQKQ
ncbi:MAG TPA: hypothetical protein PKX92_04600 [Edaphocola sp.]|nr:hypothetical protein [Edaphocola sp.]